MKKFIITVDTEGDNLWEWTPGDVITNENAKYIEIFQELCEKYAFKPVYLVNYEMAQSDILVDLLREKNKRGLCEIGMHLHAWNTPPEYEILNKYNGCPYITEYPEEVIRAKHLFLRDYIEQRFGVKPVSYRSGRWATNETLFKILNELGFLVDCSITPGIAYESNVGMSVKCGNNYRDESHEVKRICDNLFEIPMTTCFGKNIHGRSIKNRLSHLIKGEQLWLRPAMNTYKEMIRLVEVIQKKGIDYLEFMIHSSELMQGGSPYSKDERATQQLFERIEKFFEYISNEYEGVTLSEYYERYLK